MSDEYEGAHIKVKMVGDQCFPIVPYQSLTIDLPAGTWRIGLKQVDDEQCLTAQRIDPDATESVE